MKNHGTRLFVILLVVLAAVMAFAKGGIRYGLDLAGGASLTYEVKFEGGPDIADADERRQQIVRVLDKRLNAAGLGGISIAATEEGQILIEIPGRSKDQLDDIKDILRRNGELEFRIVASPTETQTQRKRRDDLGDMYPTPEGYRWVPQRTPEGELGVRPEMLVKIPEAKLLREVGELEESSPGSDELRSKKQALLEIQKEEYFTGEHLAKTAVQRGQAGELVVYFEFRTERSGDFHDFTTRNEDELMAIILDGAIDSAPTINEPLPGRGVISGGGPGGFKETEARQLTIVLESGSVGAELVLDREEILGPSLGADAIHRGKLSILIGFVLVLLLMGWYYRGPGMVANVGLLLNVALLIGALAFFRAALTLAGIAGIVLTLGMAVDANILIFERLKEERARGKSLLEAVAAGYDRAFVAIVDANVTTVLTALVLIMRGSGTVRGFGITLTIGILASMFTAIFVTRAIFEWLIDSGRMKEMNMGAPHRFTFDFMAKRRFFTGPSLVAMVLGAALFVARDDADKKDLEFIGGQQVIVQLNEALDRDAVRVAVRTDEFQDIQAIKLANRGTNAPTADHSNRWRIRTPLEDQAAGERFVANVESAFAGKLLDVGVTAFGTKLGSAGAADTASFQLHLLELPADTTPESIATALDTPTLPGEIAPFQGSVVMAVDGKALAFDVTTTPREAGEIFAKDNARLQLQAADPPLYLSDPMPSLSFLNPGRAQQLWRNALQAVLIAMLLQIVYIRLRFADYKHGFAAVCALIHDVSIALGIVMVADALGIVEAKINLVLIAGFLTLIGYSMNDTIVVFDRIRENLGKSKVVRKDVVNGALNETLNRSIRTSITTLVVVLIQFLMNYGSGSVLEGFAFVMVIGVISGTYSSIFIAGPLLLFLPDYWRRFSENRQRMWLQLAATFVGAITAVVATDNLVLSIVGLVLASNVVLHFLFHFIPWLGLDDPDALLVEEIEVEERDRPLHKPGI